MPLFTDLVKQMLGPAEALDLYLLSADLPPTSFENDTLLDLPSELEQARDSLVDVAQTTKRLAQGSRGTLREILLAFADETSLRAIYHYELAQHVPLSRSTTFAEISASSGLPLNLVERFVRQAMSNRIFAENCNQPGHVFHTATSRLLATDPDAHNALGLFTCEISPICQGTLDAIAACSGSQEQSAPAWALHNEIGTTAGEFLTRYQERARRLDAGLEFLSRGSGWDPAQLEQLYDWKSLDLPGSVFVDVGGGRGTVPQTLSRVTTNMQFVVQDLPVSVREGRAALPQELTTRIKFQEHDFFLEQPVKGADVYFFRWVLHNWSDKYCKKILRALIPALKVGSRVIIYEIVLRDGPEVKWSRKQPRLVHSKR
ncbi:MAG: hypothetical protein Q9165_004313 [Trypethelium subeluteriae]